MTSPFGVKTKTSVECRSKRSESMNSPGSVGLVLPVEQLAQPGHVVALDGVTAAPPSLYFQCAAMPYSARRCISSVRICISTGLPAGPITVVCSDWYMLNLGIAM